MEQFLGIDQELDFYYLNGLDFSKLTFSEVNFST
jgi:hypothetical protein